MELFQLLDRANFLMACVGDRIAELGTVTPLDEACFQVTNKNSFIIKSRTARCCRFGAVVMPDSSLYLPIEALNHWIQ